MITMAANGGPNHSGTKTMTTKQERKSSETLQAGNIKKQWKLPKSNMSKDVQIIEDVETEAANLPNLAVDKSDTSSILQTDDKHIRVPLPPVTSQQNESLTVPGALPGSSDAFDEQNRSLHDSVSLLSLKSSRSIESRIRNAVVRMPPGTEENPKDILDPEESWIRSAIPNLLLGQAIVCLILNVILPGTGTMLSGFFIFCGGKSRIPSKTETDIIMTLCVNVWVGVSQLFTVSFLMVGWFWSLAWGINMVILSVEWRKEQKLERAKQLQTLALSAFNTNVNGRTS